MQKPTVSDLLEFLYLHGRRDLADIVILMNASAPAQKELEDKYPVITKQPEQ